MPRDKEAANGVEGPMDTKEILKYVLVIGALPWVLPFVKALARDLIQAFEEDGGLMGPPPTKAKIEEIRRRKERRGDPLIAEPLAHIRAAAKSPAAEDTRGKP